MKKILTLLSLAALISALAVPASAKDADHTLTPKTNMTIEGSTGFGTNVDYHNISAGVAGRSATCKGVNDPQFTCEEFFIKTDAMLNFDDEDTTNDKYNTWLRLTLNPDLEGVDYDLELFDADANGKIGAEIKQSALGPSPVADPFGIAGPVEFIEHQMKIDTREENIDYFIVRVVFFAAGGGYDLNVTF